MTLIPGTDLSSRLSSSSVWYEKYSDYSYYECKNASRIGNTFNYEYIRYTRNYIEPKIGDVKNIVTSDKVNTYPDGGVYGGNYYKKIEPQ